MKSGEETKNKPMGQINLSVLAVFIGVISGLGAVAFRGLIAFFHNLFFFGKLSFFYDANVHTPASPWGIFVILVPVVGAAGVTFLVQKLAPEAKGPGVSEVLDAIYNNKGIIRPVVAVAKSLASALSIGSGGSVGREGPIIQIGSTLGSSAGQIFRMSVWQRITLMTAGAAGGIAATFNTPVGGVLFAMELMLHEVSVRTLVPVAISTATAAYIGRLFLGPHPSFVIPGFETPYFHVTDPAVLLSYVVLGLIIGIISTVYIKSIYIFEDFFNRFIKRKNYLRHMTGMAVVGVAMYLLMVNQGHYYIEGVGYSTVQDVLSGTLSQFYLLLLLFFLKLLTTSLTLGSGGSGGFFSPSLYLGATFGGAYGIIVQSLFPAMAVSPPAFAVAGMAGLVGGSTGAAMAAIVMIFEMTLDYSVIIPMTITVALSYGVRKAFSKESVYTMKLVRRGHFIPESLKANFYESEHARDIADTNFTVVTFPRKIDELAGIVFEQADISHFIVVEDRKVVGIVSRESALQVLRQCGKTAVLNDFINRNYVTVAEEMTLTDILNEMHFCNASIALVTAYHATGEIFVDNVKGVITKQQIADTIEQAIEQFGN